MAIDNDQNGDHLQTDPAQAIDMELDPEPDQIMEEVNDGVQLNFSFLDDSDRDMLLNSPPAYEEFSDDNELGLCTEFCSQKIVVFSFFSFHGLESQ